MLIELTTTNEPKYSLLLDDVRNVQESCDLVGLSPTAKGDTLWRIARNFNEFQQIITIHGIPSVILFDHDLGYDAVNNKTPSGLFIPSTNFTTEEKTGKYCAQWLLDYCHDNSLFFPSYWVHSQNSVGRENIKSLIENAIRVRFVRSM